MEITYLVLRFSANLKPSVMKNPAFFFLFGLLLICLFVAQQVQGQTNPTAQSLPFSFASQSGSTLPAGMAVHRFATIPTTRTTAPANADLPYNSNGSAGGWDDEAANGISLLASGSQPAGALVVAINTTSLINVQVSWKAGTVLQQASRDNSIALQYRVGTSGTWTDIGTGTTYTTQGKTAGDVSGTLTETLPAAAEGQTVVQVRWIYWESNGSSGSRDRINIDAISITGSPAAVPEINIKQNTTSIASGGTHDFGSAEVGTNLDVTFTIENLGGATLNITTPLSASGDYSNIISQPSSTVAASGSTTFTVRFTPTALGTRTGAVTITNDDSNEGSYEVNFTGTGTGSSVSVIQSVANSGVSSISSVTNGAINTVTDGVQVWQFDLFDGNGTNDDNDALPTIYTELTLNQGTGNTVANWSTATGSVRFFEGSTLLAGTVTVNSTSIVFTPTTSISVSDGAASKRTISMRLTVANPLPANSDGDRYVFKFIAASQTVASVATSSQLAAFSDQLSSASQNLINVSATQLVYTSIPPSAPVNNNFSVYVEACDANGNLDEDNTTSVTLAKTAGTGTFSVSNATKNLAAGVANWTDANHNTAETITLETSGSGLTAASANVTIINAPYQLFDNFNRTSSSTVGIPSSGGLASWSETENNGGGCTNTPPANRNKIRVSNNQLELSNCYEGNSGSCGGTVSEQISFDMNGKYATTFNTASSTMEWYLNIRQSRANPSGFGSGSYGAAFILGSTESNFTSGTAQGYALTIGNTSTPDPIRLVSFNGQVSNQTYIIIGVGDGADVVDNYLSVKVTYAPSTNTWGLYVRDDGAAFADPTTISVSGATATNSTYTNLNLRYTGALWNHSSSCEEILLVDNVNIPVATSSLPEIKVEYTTTNAVEISDGGSFDFGRVNTAGGSYTATFTITNLGTGSLTLGTLGVAGGDAGDFTVTQPGSATLAPSATTTFTVTFDPSANGARTTTLSFSNNDSDENPFNFTLNGEGVPQMPVINEFVADHDGSDTKEFIEVFGEVSTNYSNLTLLVLEGEGSNKGEIDNIISVGTSDAAGYWLTGYLSDQIENGTITILLVMNFSGSLNQDLDANDDGTLDNKPWIRILDDVALRVSGADAAYSSTIIVPNFDGVFLTPGGASRIPNGADTDNISDWMRNDFDGWGLAGFSGTANANETKNTPKRVNVRFNVWLGTTTVWTNAANWTVRVPDDTTEALIPTIGSSTYPVITGIVTYDCFGLYFTSTASNISIGAGAEIRNFYDFESNSNSSSFGAGRLSFEGSVATKISGTFTIGELACNNANGVTIQSGSTVNVTDKLLPEAGTLTNSGSLVLKSSATKTAYVDDFTDPTPGTISGNITMERYIPATGGGNTFHYIGAVSSASLSSKWGDDFGISVTGSNGYVTPLNCNPATPSLDGSSNYGTVFTYHESNVTSCYLSGWKVENGSYNALPGSGYAARISNGTIDETGAYSNSNVSVSGLTASSGNLVTYSQGYNLVANPFYAPISTSGIITDLANDPDWDGSVFIYDPSSGNYSASNFLLVNPATIGTNQAFFIKASSGAFPSSTLDFVFDKSRRTAGNNSAFYRQPQLFEYGLNIMVENNGKTDKTLIAFDESFNDDFDKGYDAMKLYNDAGVPSMYVKSGSEQRAINALPPVSGNTRSVPLSILITASGTHTFSFSGMEDFPSTVVIWLEDLKTGTWTNLRLANSYSFSANVGDDNDRFILHFTPPVLMNTAASSCAGNDGQISLTIPQGIDWSYTIQNSQGSVISRQSGVMGNVIANGLSAGNYTVTLIYDGSYRVTEMLPVPGAMMVSADFTPSLDNLNAGESVQFENLSTGATDYEWNFGDGTVITGVAEPMHSYLHEGTYTVTLRAFNGDCEDVMQTIVRVNKLSVGINNAAENKLQAYSFNGTVFLNFEFAKTEDAEVTILNLLGQQIYRCEMKTEGARQIRLQETRAQYVLLSVQTADVCITRKLFILE